MNETKARFSPEVEADWYRRVRAAFDEHNTPERPLKGRPLLRTVNHVGKSLLVLLRELEQEKAAWMLRLDAENSNSLRLQEEVERLKVKPEALTEELAHGRNCPAWHSPETGYEVNGEDCTCGYRWRVHLQTEQNLRAAWMKRAMEAEVECDALKAQLVGLRSGFRDQEMSKDASL